MLLKIQIYNYSSYSPPLITNKMDLYYVNIT